MWQIYKFGGTSVADAASIRSVVSIMRQTDSPLAVVVSAIAGVTDALSDTCALAAKRDPGYVQKLEAIKTKQLALAAELGCSDNGFVALFAGLQDVLRAIFVTHCASVDQLNFVLGHGELISAQLLAHTYGPEAEFIDARNLIVIKNSEDRVPKIKWKQSQRNWDSLTLQSRVLVITGFICSTADGRMATLKRNGSDLSAAIVAKLLQAEKLVIWKEVEGVYTADPRIVPEARLLPDMSFQELAELSYFGAKVIHPQAMIIAIQAKVPVVLKNTFNPSGHGTLISSVSTTESYAKAITFIKGLALVNVQGCGMLDVPGVAKRVFEACSNSGINVMLISQASSQHSIALAIQSDQAEIAKKALKDAFYKELKQHLIEEVETLGGLGIIAVVGDGMKNRKGVAARFFTAFRDADVNIIAIAQGSNESNISVVVKEEDIPQAIHSVHSALFITQ